MTTHITESIVASAATTGAGEWAGAEPTILWALQITHKYGNDFTVHRTEKSARRELALWARTYWDEVEGEGAAPATAPHADAAAVDVYFDEHPDESYDLGPAELKG